MGRVGETGQSGGSGQPSRVTETDPVLTRGAEGGEERRRNLEVESGVIVSETIKEADKDTEQQNETAVGGQGGGRDRAEPESGTVDPPGREEAEGGDQVNSRELNDINLGNGVQMGETLQP